MTLTAADDGCSVSVQARLLSAKVEDLTSSKTRLSFSSCSKPSSWSMAAGTEAALPTMLLLHVPTVLKAALPHIYGSHGAPYTLPPDVTSVRESPSVLLLRGKEGWAKGSTSREYRDAYG